MSFCAARCSIAGGRRSSASHDAAGWLYLFSSNSSPHYEQDVLNVLALPAGSRYTFAYDARHVEERALEHWLKLTGRRVVVLYALQQEAEYLPAALIPVRLGTVLSTRSIGSHRYVEFRLEEYAALPAIPPKQRPGPLVRRLSKYFAQLSKTPYDAWASIGDPIPVGLDVAVPWDSATDLAQRFERIVAYLEHTVSFNEARNRGSKTRIAATTMPWECFALPTLTPFDASLGAGRCRGARLLEVTRAKAAESSDRASAAIGKTVLLRIEDAARGQRVRPH